MYLWFVWRCRWAVFEEGLMVDFVVLLKFNQFEWFEVFIRKKKRFQPAATVWLCSLDLCPFALFSEWAARSHLQPTVCHWIYYLICISNQSSIGVIIPSAFECYWSVDYKAKTSALTSLSKDKVCYLQLLLGRELYLYFISSHRYVRTLITRHIFYPQ